VRIFSAAFRWSMPKTVIDVDFTTTLGVGGSMARYLLLAFEYDDEFGMFPDDLEIMLFRHSKPPYSIKVVGEAKGPYNLDEDKYYKVVPIGKASSS
jgi:hypothetical protein